MSSKTTNKNYIIFFGTIILIAIFLVGVPVFPVTVEESYEVTVPYEKQEPYERARKSLNNLPDPRE